MATLHTTIALLERLIWQRFKLRNHHQVEGVFDVSAQAFTPAFGRTRQPWFAHTEGRIEMRELRDHVAALRLLRLHAERSSKVRLSAARREAANVIRGRFGGQGY